jgi:hypothetical protein
VTLKGIYAVCVSTSFALTKVARVRKGKSVEKIRNAIKSFRLTFSAMSLSAKELHPFGK